MQNLLTVIKALEKIGASLPNVNTVILSDIYQLNSLPNIDYSVFAIVQDQHRKDDNFTYLGFYLYYVDRLLNDRSNQIEIQSHGLEILSEVIDKIEDLGLILSPEFDRVLQPFNQRFSDECAGIYCRLEIMIPQDCMIAYDILVNPKLANLAVYKPGTYYPSDYGADGFRVVDVSGQSYQYYTENEEDKTAKIDNEYHNIEVNKSGATYDGYQIVNTNILSAYTYSKNETDDRISQTAIYYYNQLEPRVAQNEQDIAELSGNTSANTTNINTLSGITSALTEQIEELSGLTDDFVRKDPEKSDEIVNLNDLIETGYYYIPGNKSTNAPIAWADAMLHTIKKTDDGTSMIVQYFTTTINDDNRFWPRTYFRSLGWNITQSAITWSAWHEVATSTNAYMTDAGYVVGSSAHTIDFNSFVQKGGYYFIRSFGFAENGPRQSLWEGILEVVWKFDGNGLQRYTEMLNGAPHTYIRYRSWDGWSDWYEYTLTPLDSKNTEGSF